VLGQASRERWFFKPRPWTSDYHVVGDQANRLSDDAEATFVEAVLRVQNLVSMGAPASDVYQALN